MEIFIGRHEGDRKLAVTVGNKTALIGEEESVPKSVSRRHCKIMVDESGNMTLENLKPENITTAGGAGISRTRICETDDIRLGSEGYRLDIGTIVQTARRMLPKQQREPEQLPTYSIDRLERVYNDYQKELEEYNIKKQKQAAIQSVSGIMSMMSIGASLIPGAADFRVWFYGLAFVLAVAFIIIRYTGAAKDVQAQKDMRKRFEDNYVCPNPRCRFPFLMPYKQLKNIGECPKCHSRLV